MRPVRPNLLARLALLILPITALATMTASASEAVITKPSAHSVSITIDRLAKVLEAKGIKVIARVDHGAGAETAGLDLPPTELLIFGNPKLGTPLMQSDRAIGLDLPMKALAWQDAAGNVHLSYTAPAALRSRHGITDRDQVFATMAEALNALTTAATKAE